MNVTVRNVTMRCALWQMRALRYGFVRELVSFVRYVVPRRLVDAPLTREGPIGSYTGVRPIR